MSEKKFVIPQFGASDADFFEWLKKNYFAENSVTTAIYFLNSKMGKWDSKILTEELHFFQKKHLFFVECTEKLQQDFKSLQQKNDTSNLLDVINELIDCQKCAEQSEKIAEVFENFIPRNDCAVEDLRKSEVGKKLKSARRAKGFSQTELGEMIGVTKATVSTYESGQREPPIRTLIELAKKLEISLDELFNLKK